jgi:hypothetical protein
LRDALSRPLEALDESVAEDFVEKQEDLEELAGEEWQLRPKLHCENGCGAVFCGEACAAAARREGWHRILCTDLEPDRRPIWDRFRAHAVKRQETFILAAQVIAEIICLVKHAGIDLFEAMAFFTRFAKSSWVSMGQTTLPSGGALGTSRSKQQVDELEEEKRAARLASLTVSLELLSALIWERQFAEMLTLDFYSNLVGQFSLSNVWVQIEHPLSSKFCQRAKEDADFRRRFQRLAVASTRAVRQVKGEIEKGCSSLANTVTDLPRAELDDVVDFTNWMLPRFEASGLYNMMALTNHSCRPNYSMLYTDGALSTMRALRDVSEGEELHLAYVSPSVQLSERLATLWRTWGFVCTCEKCQDELMAKVLAEAADGRRGVAASGPLAQCSKRLTSKLTSKLQAAREAANRKGGTAAPKLSASCRGLVSNDDSNGSDSDSESSSSGTSLGSRTSGDENETDMEEETSIMNPGVKSTTVSNKTRGALRSALPKAVPSASRWGSNAPPPSVLRIESDLKELMSLMDEAEA